MRKVFLLLFICFSLRNLGGFATLRECFLLFLQRVLFFAGDGEPTSLVSCLFLPACEFIATRCR